MFGGVDLGVRKMSESKTDRKLAAENPKTKPAGFPVLLAN
jgi:hypothetical protein